MKQKLAVFDVDGTIMSNGKIPNSVIDALEHLRKLNYITTLSTGRCYQRLMEDIGPIYDQIVSKNALLILEHGTKIAKSNGEVVHAEYFDDSDISHIVEFIRANLEIIDYIMFAPSDPYQKMNCLCLNRKDVQKITKLRGNYSKVFFANPGELNNILLEDRYSWICSRLKPYLEIENLHLNLTKSATILNFQDKNMSFVKNSSNKSIALKYLQNHFQINDGSVLVAGNAVNDKEMLSEDSYLRILVGPKSEREVVKGYIYKPDTVNEVDSPNELGNFLLSINA